VATKETLVQRHSRVGYGPDHAHQGAAADDGGGERL